MATERIKTTAQINVTVQITAEGAMHAPADVVYRCIADYRTHHPRIVPPAFSNFVVEEGGVGTGTVVRFSLKLAGRTRTTRASIHELKPGQVLEINLDRGFYTHFTVTPEGTGSRVRIDTILKPARGLRGVMERLFAPRLLRPLYADELARLDHYARMQAAVDPPKERETA